MLMSLGLITVGEDDIHLHVTASKLAGFWVVRARDDVTHPIAQHKQ